MGPSASLTKAKTGKPLQNGFTLSGAASDPDPRHENEFLEGAVDKTDTQTYNVYFSQSP
jgi:hypothetical protein